MKQQLKVPSKLPPCGRCGGRMLYQPTVDDGGAYYSCLQCGAVKEIMEFPTQRSKRLPKPDVM